MKIDKHYTAKTKFIRDVILMHQEAFPPDPNKKQTLRDEWYTMKHIMTNAFNPVTVTNAAGNKKIHYTTAPFDIKRMKKSGSALGTLIATNLEYRGEWHKLREEGLIQDSHIVDLELTWEVGSILPHIVFAVEKKTFTNFSLDILHNLGVSYYVTSGDSSFYGRREVLEYLQAFTNREPYIITLSDRDTAGERISETLINYFGGGGCRIGLDTDMLSEREQDELFYGYCDKGERAYEIDIIKDRVRYISALEEKVRPDIVEEIQTENIKAREADEKERIITEKAEAHPRVKKAREVYEAALEQEKAVLTVAFDKDKPITVRREENQIIDLFENGLTYRVKDNWNI